MSTRRVVYIGYRPLYHTVYYITRLYAPTSLYHSIRQFRVEQTESCDYSNMVEIVAKTAITTAVADSVCNSETYLMADWNWMDQDPFEPNVASAFYLPPVEGCCWVLWLQKRFDPIVGNNSCQCDDEDHVHFKDGDGNEKKYCDFTDPQDSMEVGWCASNNGPHNVYIQPAFVTGKKSSSSSSTLCGIKSQLLYIYVHEGQGHRMHHQEGCILPRELHRRPAMSCRGQLAQESSKKFLDCTEVLAFSIEYMGGIL